MEKAKLAIRKWLGIALLDMPVENLYARIDELEAELASFKDALKTQAAKKPAERTEQAPRPSKRYIPLATRRRSAELASQAPATHAEKVLANNIKAFESA